MGKMKKLRVLMLPMAAFCLTGAAMAVVHPWAMYRSDMFRTGQSLFPGADLGVAEWKRFVNGVVPTISVAADGKVYLGVTFHDEVWSNEEYFTVLKPDGSEAWRLKVKPYDWGGAQGVFSGPALDSVGNVVINSPFGQLRKYDPLGTLIWVIQRRSDVTNDSTPAIDQNDNVFHYQAIHGLAKYSSGGGIIWQVGAVTQSHIAVFTNGDSALGGLRTIEPHGSVDITYFNANGTVRWQHTSSRGRDGQVIFGPDGTVFQGAGAYNPQDGSVKWGTPSGGSNALGKNGQYYLIIGGSAPSVRAHNSQTGSVLWEKTLPPVGALNPLAIDSRDRIYATTSQGYLFILSPVDGSILTQTRVCDSFSTGPSIGPNNRVYAVGKRFSKDYVFSIR
jgi:hypothetical protein